MKSLAVLLATSLSLPVLAALPARGQQLSCTAADELRGRGQRKNELTLDVRNDDVVGIVYVVTVATDGKGGGVSSCRIELAEGDGLSRWSRSGSTVRVVDKKSIEDELQGAYTEVETLPDGYRLNLTHISRNHCSNEADVPATVTLKKGDKTCAVSYKAR